MCIRYRGVESKFQKCPGGGPQGGLLTCVFFILQVNKAGSPCSPTSLQQPQVEQSEQPLTDKQNKDQPLLVARTETGQLPAIRQNKTKPNAEEQRPLLASTQEEGQFPVVGQNVSQHQPEDQQQIQTSTQGQTESELPEQLPAPRQEGGILPVCHSKAKLHKKSYIDDLTLLKKISLSDLIKKKRIIGPLDFHDRFNLELPPSKAILQHQLEDLTRFTTKQSMVLNTKKTKCMPFNNSQTKDFLPTLNIKEGANLEVVYQIKLVGLVVTSNMGWNERNCRSLGPGLKQ